jgi:hypothetical protein
MGSNLENEYDSLACEIAEALQEMATEYFPEAEWEDLCQKLSRMMVAYNENDAQAIRQQLAGVAIGPNMWHTGDEALVGFDLLCRLLLEDKHE